MGHLGERLLDEGPLYNAAKHGLAVCPGAAAMTFGDQDGDFPIRADGPSITYLTVAQGENGKRWRQATTWLDSGRNIALTELTLRQVSNLWRVARHRYTGEAWDETKMKYFTAELVHAVVYGREPEGVSIVVPSMAVDLLDYAAENE